jgi:hypothetical protein
VFNASHRPFSRSQSLCSFWYSITCILAVRCHVGVETLKSKISTKASFQPFSICVCKPEAVNTVRAHDDKRFATRI